MVLGQLFEILTMRSPSMRTLVASGMSARDIEVDGQHRLVRAQRELVDRQDELGSPEMVTMSTNVGPSTKALAE
jgi:hypothetical protein